MPVKAYLFDADGADKEVQLTPQVIASLSDRTILWVDVAGSDQHELTQVASMLNLHRESLRNLLNPIGRPRLDVYDQYFQVNVIAVKEVDKVYHPLEFDLFAGPNYAVTFHPEPIDFLETFDRQVRGDTQIGSLTAASFLAALLDWHVSSYFAVLHNLEDEVDRLDEMAILAPANRKFLRQVVALRRRVSYLRQLIAPHQEVFAALARPDFEAIAHTTSAAHFRALDDRLDRAIASVEHAREMVIGTFELFMTGTSQSTNDTMKVLTLVTVLVGLMGVIAGTMGMNFTTELFEAGTPGFALTIVGMIILCLIILSIARLRRWL